MERIGILVKSYADDLEYVRRLAPSLRRHNINGLPVFFVVPEEDVSIFTEVVGEVGHVLSEAALAENLVKEPTAGFSAGYVNQEIVKLSFWELGLVDNYFCVDSDAEFIRDFTAADFMADASTPYTLLTEDADLQVERDYFTDTWVTRAESLDRIREAIGYEGLWPLTVHGHAIFASRVLSSFRDEFLTPRGWAYVDALKVSPYEPSWYNAWLLHRKPIEIIRRDPLVKTFHTPTQHLEYVLRGVTEQDVSRGFLAVVVNSNFSRGEGVVPLIESPTQALASYVQASDLLRAAAYRVHRKLLIEREPWRRSRRAVGAWALQVPVLRNYVDAGDPNA